MRDSKRKLTLTKKLGHGGMGQVWRAVQEDESGMHRVVAVKVLWPALAMDEEDRERLSQEARIAAQLEHSGVVKVLGTTVVQGSPALIMEWVDGVNLRELQEKAKAAGTPWLGLNNASRVVGDVAEIFVHTHGRTVAGENAAVIHSDVTLGNILVSSNGEVKLADFGIARFARMCDKTMSRAVGTRRYMAPEQMRGRISPATDMYGLGVVFTELLEGEDYLAGCSGDELQFKVLSGHVPELKRKGVPKSIDELRRAMLSPEPRDRPRPEDVHTMLAEQSENYALARIELKRLYHRCVGDSSSGFTELLELRHGGDQRSFFASVFGHDPNSNPPPSPAASTETRPEAPVLADAAETDPDAPAVLRRRGRSSGSGNRETVDYTNTAAPAWVADDEPAVEPTTVLPALDTGDVVASEAATRNDGPSEMDPPTMQEGPGGLPKEQTLPFPPAFLSAAPTPVVSDATPIPVEVAVVVGDEQRTPTMDMLASEETTAESPAQPEAQATGGSVWMRYLAMAAGAAAFLSAGVFIASVAMTVDEPEDKVADIQTKPTTNNEAAAVKPEPEPEAEAKHEPTPEQPETAAANEEVVAPPDPALAPVSADGEQTNKPTAADTEEDPPKIEVEPKTKPDPKPKLEPAVTVSFVIIAKPPGKSKAAEIKASGKRFTTDNGFKKATLRPGTYQIQWRWVDGSWHELDVLRVESGLPSGSYYSVKLDLENMAVSKTLGDK